MMTLRRGKLDRACLSFVVIISVLCSYLVVHHVTRQKRQLLKENDLLSKKLKDLDLADTNLEHLKAALETTRNELKVINDQIPETAEIGTFLKKIDSLMKERKVMLINIEPIPTIKMRDYVRIPILLQFKGSFEDTYKILHDLETMNRLLVMENINISKSTIDKYCQVSVTTCIFAR